MIWHALVVVVFLLNGEPVLLGEIIPMDKECGEDQAKELASSMGFMIQDDILWDCKEVTSPAPIKHVPGRDEAT